MEQRLTLVEDEPRAVAGLFPLHTFNDWTKYAQLVAVTKLIPLPYQGKWEDVIVAWSFGKELGLAPMASLQSIAVINGRPGIYGDGFVGIIQASPHYLKHVEYFERPNGDQVQSLRGADYQHDDTRAVCHVWRKGIAEPFVAEFSIGDAKRAGLWTKGDNWSKYPARMLKWRARGYAMRDAFADVLRGIKPAWELEDEEPVVAPAPAAAITPPTRRSEKAAAAAAPTPESSDPVLTNELPDAPPTQPTLSRVLPPMKPRAEKVTNGAPPPAASVQTGDLIITDTQYLTPKDADPYYEIRARVDKAGVPAVGYVFVTRDKAVYDLAASAEGTPQHFAITWKRGKRPDASECKIAEEIVAG